MKFVVKNLASNLKVNRSSNGALLLHVFPDARDCERHVS